MKTYSVNEIFYSLQGEGVRAGTAAVFVRFAGCNLRCTRESVGFDCDTEYTEFTRMTVAEIVLLVDQMRAEGLRWVILTGGEPALQVDAELMNALRQDKQRLIAIETNGTVRLLEHFDWVTVSPKPGTKLKVRHAHEVRYVLAFGQKPPEPCPIRTIRQTVSPAFDGTRMNREALAWCIRYVLEHPEWRLSVQQHKQWGIP